MHLFMLLFLSASALGAKLLIVGEHHFDRRYRVAFDQILQADRTVRCVFLEDSPQMDAAAARFLAGGGDFTSVYLARYFEVGAAMGMERADLQSIWDHNYAGRELILASAKRRGLKVYHVDYSSDQSAGFVPLEGDASIQWNYIRRHEIMAENMARHRRECPRAMALVGESHIDVPRVLEMMRRSRGPGFRYTGPPIRSLGAHTTSPSTQPRVSKASRVPWRRSPTPNSSAIRNLNSSPATTLIQSTACGSTCENSSTACTSFAPKERRRSRGLRPHRWRGFPSDHR